MFSLNPAGEPIYRQIVEQVRRMVSSGQLPVGAELPSVRDIAQRFTVNPMTVSKAYSLLEAEGLIERQRGKPMRIAAAAAAKQVDKSSLLQPQLAQLLLSAKQLDMSLDEVITQITAMWPDQPANGRSVD
jgi:GntR family transcriptional regulator